MPLSVGDKLGPYEILALIGAGGMGEVYRATDTRLHRTVAIKILPREKVADAERKKRFLQEARAASALNHPNIITLHDIAHDSGVDYLVMEFVPGKSLDKLITPKGLPLVEALNYCQQIASGLAAAHAAGIVHRDIKPANVIISAESQVKILDFGLAKLIEHATGTEEETRTQEAALTHARTVMGTVAYMSPEQASARPLDHRTDIFSLGVVLYEMLAGARPFRCQSQVETMHAIIHDPAPPLRAEPPEMQEILDKALAKDPKDRYQHAGDLGLDLRRFQKAWESKSLASTRGMSASARKQGLRWGVVWIALAAAVAVSVASGWFLRGARTPVENPLANAQFTRFTDFEGSDAAISQDGRFVVFRSDRDGPADTWVSQVGSGHFVNLTNGTRPSTLVRNADFTPDGSEIWFAAIPGGDRMRMTPSMGGTLRPFLSEHTQNLAWSHDGSHLVFHKDTPGDPMFVADSAGSNPRQIFALKAGGHNHFPIWSSDARWIYFVSGLWDAREMDIWRIRPSGGTPERLTNQNSDIRYLARLDDRTILYVSPDQNGAGPWLWALDTERKVSRRISSGLEVYTSVDASADGRRLAVTVSNPTANLWSFPILDRRVEEKDVKPYSLPSVRAYAPRFGGASLFYLSSRGGGDGLWRYDGRQATEIWRGADGALFEPPAVSLDGRRVAIILRKQGRRTLNALSADGGDVRPLAPAIDVTSAPSWSPDGKWIVAGGGVAGKGPGLFKIPLEGGDPQRLADGTATNPVWSPDGSVIVYTGPVVSLTGPLLIVRPDGTPVDTPAIRLRVGSEHYRFVPGRRELVYVPTTSQGVSENFWLLDLATKKTRQLANFDSHATRTFDITPDGKQLVFDRLRENSVIVLVDLPEKAK
jgi:Tol biopolymer transport system component/tRNA A-37 threonylcarbamoyl transferase component Bud32